MNSLEHGYQVDVAGDMAVVTYRYEMVYGGRFRSIGRDLNSVAR
jgi:hypothetical protein